MNPGMPSFGNGFIGATKWAPQGGMVWLSALPPASRGFRLLLR
jgi:hypothetical protein